MLVSHSEPLADLPAPLLDAVRIALSQAVLDNSDERLGATYVLQVALAWYAHAGGWIDGTFAPPIDAVLPTRGYRTGEAAMRAVNCDRQRLAAMWGAERQRHGDSARVPDDVLAAFVAPSLWPVAAALVRDGPFVATLRQTESLHLAARETVVRDTRQRGAGPVSRNTLALRQAMLRRFMRRLCRLRLARPDNPFLEPWVALPEKPRPPGAVVATDLSAPPRTLLRRLFVVQRSELHRRLNCTDDNLLERIADLSPRQLSRARSWRLLRNFCLFLVLSVLGMRRQAVQRLTVAHLQCRAAQFGSEMWVLVTTPLKGLPRSDERTKPLPGQLALYLRALQLMTDRLLGYQRVGDAPLLAVALTRPSAPVTGRRIGQIIGGFWPPDGAVSTDKRNWASALVPRDPAAAERLFDTPHRSAAQCLGYHPHALRGAAMQMVRYGGGAYLAQHGITDVPEPATLAEILVDHWIPDDKFGYHDIDTPHGRERYSGLAAEIAWAMLTTDLGARRSIDVEAWQEAARLRNAVEAELQATCREIDRSAAALTALERQARSIDQRRTSSRGRDTLLLHGWTAERAYAALRERRAELRDRLAATDAEIEALKHDPARRIVVSDLTPDGEIVTRPEDLELGIEGTITIAGRRFRRVRLWCTLGEFAVIADVAAVTVRRWARGEHLPHRYGDPRRPWDPDDIPVERLSPRRQIVWIDRVRPTFFDTEAKRLALERTLAEPHPVWGITPDRTSLPTPG